MNHNPIVLTDARAGSFAKIDTNLTNEKEYSPIVAAIKSARDMLLANVYARAPFLAILSQVYNESSSSSMLRSTCPSPPTDKDIQLFFAKHFPGVRLVWPATTTSTFLYGYTNYGPENCEDSNVQISFPIVGQWLNLMNPLFHNQTSKQSIVQLRALFIGIFLHELGHRILVWWSHGLCDTPKLPSFSSESGIYIERAFFGGVLECWWDAGEVGNFGMVKQITIETVMGTCWNIDTTAGEKMLSFGDHHSLPLLSLEDMEELPIPMPGTIIRAKVGGYEGQKDRGLTDVTEQKKEAIGLGIVFARIQNDKLRK